MRGCECGLQTPFKCGSWSQQDLKKRHRCKCNIKIVICLTTVRGYFKICPWVLGFIQCILCIVHKLLGARKEVDCMIIYTASTKGNFRPLLCTAGTIWWLAGSNKEFGLKLYVKIWFLNEFSLFFSPFFSFFFSFKILIIFKYTFQWLLVFEYLLWD